MNRLSKLVFNNYYLFKHLKWQINHLNHLLCTLLSLISEICNSFNSFSNVTCKAEMAFVNQSNLPILVNYKSFSAPNSTKEHTIHSPTFSNCFLRFIRWFSILLMYIWVRQKRVWQSVMLLELRVSIRTINTNSID